MRAIATVNVMALCLLLVAACGDGKEGPIDLTAIQSGIYNTSAVISSTCTYAQPGTGPSSFDSVQGGVFVDTNANSIRLPFRYSGTFSSTNMLDLAEAQGYVFTAEHTAGCGLTSKMTYTLKSASGSEIQATGERSWTNVTSPCDVTPLPDSDCNDTTTFSYSLTTSCEAPCTVIESAVADPPQFDCQCN